MLLTEVQPNRNLKIVKITSGKEAKRKLGAIGINPDDTFVRLTRIKWGPILVQNITDGGSKVAIGRGLAEKIEVEYDK